MKGIKMNWKDLFEMFYKRSLANYHTLSDDYEEEWKRRFESGWEWQYSDYRNRRILQSIAPDIYPENLDTFFHREEKENN